MAKIRFGRSPSTHQTTTTVHNNESTLMNSKIAANPLTAVTMVASNNELKQQQQIHGTSANDNSIGKKKTSVSMEGQPQHQLHQSTSDKRKTSSSSFRFLTSFTSSSRHKKQREKQPNNVSPTQATSPSPPSSSYPLPAATTSTTSTSTIATSTAGRFLSGRGKFKRPSLSISITTNGSTQLGTSTQSATTKATPPPTATTTTTTTAHADDGKVKNGSKRGIGSGNGTTNNSNTTVNTIKTTIYNKTVISTPLPPYEIDVTDIDGVPFIECPLCVLLVSYKSTPDLKTCGHRTCMDCMQRYLKTEINHSRLNITCPICSEPLLQNVIRETLNDDKFYFKYESFMLRKVLAAEPDARWCPAPDCGYAVLANGCASCPRLICERVGCNTAFCYHCKQEWHPNQTCSAASIQRNKRAGLVLDALNISDLIEESSTNEHSSDGGQGRGSNQRKSSKSSQPNATLRPEDIKECPVCSSRIIKMNDGSCNHMTCSICETEFCWLCMKEISDFHYFSPSGCTFWGKKPWSRKKKLLWRLGMLVGAPICIVFIAGIAVPAIVIGIPVWAARKLHTRLEKKQFSRYRKNAIITGGVLLSFVVSPIISAMALAVGIPILLGYVYGVVPLSLCRSSGGCLSASPSVENIHEQFAGITAARNRLTKTPASTTADVASISTATSHKLGNPSIGGTSLYTSNISLETNSLGLVTNVERDDRENASNAGLAGSILSQNMADDGNSTRALAGSIISKESSGYTLVPVEVHNQQSGTSQTVKSPATSSNEVKETTNDGQALATAT